MRIPDAVRTLDRDLRDVFGARLHSVVVYRAAHDRSASSTLAVVASLSADDLRACADRLAAWQDNGLEAPLLLVAGEFKRSLDAFPFEFGVILAGYAVVSGADPFAGLTVSPGDLRHACEIQARGHLLHLREGFIETRGRSDAVAELIVRSAEPLSALVTSVCRLEGREAADAEAAAAELEAHLSLAPRSLRDVIGLTRSPSLGAERARELFRPYLESVEALTRYIDQWSAA